MTWRYQLDDFSGLCTILEGDRVVACSVGKVDAQTIVDALTCFKNRRLDVTLEKAREIDEMLRHATYACMGPLFVGPQQPFEIKVDETPEWHTENEE